MTSASDATVKIAGVDIAISVDKDKGVFEPWYVSLDDALYNLPLLEKCESALDMGTGSGVLACLWVKLFKNLKRVVAVDRDPNAVRLACRNLDHVTRNGQATGERGTPDTKVVGSNLFEELGTERFDAIIFNGPHVREHNEALHTKYGERYFALYDPGLKIADGFFAGLDEHLTQDEDGPKQDAFALYTFSDYGSGPIATAEIAEAWEDPTKAGCLADKCALVQIFDMIRQRGLRATLHSVVRFTERDNEFEPDWLADPKQPGHQAVRVWYNILIKRRMTDREVLSGFRRGLESIAGWYSAAVPTERLYREFQLAVARQFECLNTQLSVPASDDDREWSTGCLGPKDWLIAGYTLPGWRDAPSITRSHFAFGQSISEDERSSFVKYVNDLVYLLKDKEKEWSIQQITGTYFSNSQSADALEAVLAEERRTRNGEMRLEIRGDGKQETRLYYSIDPSDSVARFVSPNSLVDPATINLIATELETVAEPNIARDRGIAAVQKQHYRELARNLWLNFRGITCADQSLRCVRFQRLSNTPGFDNGSVYLATSMRAFTNAKVHELVVTLEEVYRIANLAMQSMIAIDRRNRHAMRSAVAAIMGRNMSHNIGSHVLANTHLASYGAGPQQRLLNYLQHRMDFIAQISTTSPTWSVPMDLLTLVKGFAENEILIDTICQFANIRCDHTEIRLGMSLNAAAAVPVITWKQRNDGWGYGNKTYDAKRTFEGRLCEVPHGNVGAQALYSVLENIIRNSARHGEVDLVGATSKFGLDLDFHMPPAEGGFVKLVITDRVPTRMVTGGDDTANRLSDLFQAQIVDPGTGQLDAAAWGMKEIKISASYLRMVPTEDVDLPTAHRQPQAGAEEPVPVTARPSPPRVEVRWKAGSESNVAGIGRVAQLEYVLHFETVKSVQVVGQPFGVGPPVPEQLAEWAAGGVDHVDDLGSLRVRYRTERIRHDFLVVDTGAAATLLKAGEASPEDGDPPRHPGDILRAALPSRIIVIGQPPAADDEPLPRWCEKSLCFASDAPSRLDRADLVAWCWSTWCSYWWPQNWIELRNWDTVRLPAVGPAGEDRCPERSLCFDHSDGQHVGGPSRYHQAISHGGGLGNLLERRALERCSEEDRKVLAERLREMASLRVLVLDERIYQQSLKSLAGSGLVDRLEARTKYAALRDATVGDIWRERGVTIADHALSGGGTAALVERLVGEASTPEPGKPTWDFIVLHQGLATEYEKRDSAFNIECFAEQCRHLVIVTGRGRPTLAREGYRWIEYSNLEQCILGSVGDKSFLTRLLNSIRADSEGRQ